MEEGKPRQEPHDLRRLCAPFGAIAAAVLREEPLPDFDTRLLWCWPIQKALADIAMAERPPKVAEVAQALEILKGGPRVQPWQSRVLAAAILGRAELPPDYAGRVAAALADAVTRHAEPPARRVLNRTIRAASRLIFGGYLVFVFWAFSSDILLMWGDAPLWLRAFRILLIAVGALLSWGLLGMAPRFLLADARQEALARATAAEALGRLGRPEQVGALAAAAFDLSPSVRRAAREALQRTLPLLRPEHYGAVDGSTVPDLCRLLVGARADVSLRTAILAAFHHVGDSRAIPAVESLTAGIHPRADRAEAEALLPVLRARQARERSSGRLLRPAYDPAPELLRPAADTETPREQLLRASVRDDAEEMGPPS